MCDLPLFEVDKDADTLREGVVARVVRRWAQATALRRRKISREKTPPPDLKRVGGDVVMAPVRGKGQKGSPRDTEMLYVYIYINTPSPHQYFTRVDSLSVGVV